MHIARTLLLAAMALSLPAAAADEPQSVEIKGTRNPELKTYRIMLAGLEAFDDYHALAPQAPEVRFRLRARSASTVDLDGLTVQLSGETVSIPLPVDAENRFSLPRDRQAEREDAQIVLNKPKGNIRWQPDVRTPGVPDNMRRLGDLRLECRVLVATAKKEIGFMLTAFINSAMLTTDWCGYEKINIATTVPHKIASATLLQGEQRIPLAIRDKGMAFLPPLGDKAYADDALIELRPADE